jgi:hypothetical protein
MPVLLARAVQSEYESQLASFWAGAHFVATLRLALEARTTTGWLLQGGGITRQAILFPKWSRTDLRTRPLRGARVLVLDGTAPLACIHILPTRV